MVMDKLSPNINQLAYMSESLKVSTSLVEKSVDSLCDPSAHVTSDQESLRKLMEDLENTCQSHADENKALLAGLQEAAQKLDVAVK